MERTNVPAIVMVLMVLLVPAVAGVAQDVPEASPSGSGALRMEDDMGKVPVSDTPSRPLEMSNPIGWSSPTKYDPSRQVLSPPLEGLTLSSGTGSSEIPDIGGMMAVPQSSMSMRDMDAGMTRASDLEKEKGYFDYANGSRVEVPLEVVSGTLTYAPERPEDDQRDWYKIDILDVQQVPSSPNALHWIKLKLLSYSNGTGGTEGIYEFNVIEGDPPTLESDYGDLLGITVMYFDPWLGPTYMGGESFFYDDMDDTDGASYRNGWYYNCTTPVASTGPEDQDGFANGLTEVGWYYIGINIDFYIKTGAPTRDPFSVRYELLVDTSERLGSDEGANVREAALENAPSGESTITSHTDHVDWYKFDGEDSTKIWNQTLIINRTDGIRGRIGDILYDTWMYLFFIWMGPGDDLTYGTSDDGLVYDYRIFSYFLVGGRFISDESQSLSAVFRNDWVDAADRSVLVGIYIEPKNILISGTNILGFLDPTWSTFSNLTIDYRLTEEQFNRRPVISSLTVSSSNQFYPTQGDLRDTFTFEAVYTDPDNDPPERLDLFVGPKEDVWTTFSLLGGEKDPTDTKFTDGKTYFIRLTGEQLGSYPMHHSVKMNATDMMEVWSIRSALTSRDRWMNGTLFVFDDRPVLLNTGFEGLDPMTEDGGRYSVHLERRTGNGPFDDPENDFRGFNIWDASLSRWVTDTTVGPLDVNVSLDPVEGWMLYLEPLQNMHGEAVLRLKAYDDHSYVETSLSAQVESVNDPPAFIGVVAGTRTFDVTEVLPSKFKADLKGQYDLKEDGTYTVTLKALDQDPEEDRSPLTFGFVASRSDNWDLDPVVDPSSGEVTIRPTNNDAIKKSSKMTFEVDDGKDNSELELLFTVKNVNDPPDITIGDDTLDVVQGERVRIQVTGRDIDPGDSLTYSVNFEEDLGGQYGSVMSQLLYFAPVKGVDWDIDIATGEVWFEPSDDDIWRDATSLLMERTVHLLVQVKDGAGATAAVQVTLTLLKADIWVPRTPQFTYSMDDEDALTPGIQSLTIELTSGEYDEGLYPGWEYSWEFGDGSRKTGRTVNHTYLQEGLKTISLRLTKDAYASGPRYLNISLVRPLEPEPEPPGNGNGGSEWAIIAVIAVVVALVIVAVVVFLLLRGRKGGGDGPDGGSRPDHEKPLRSEPPQRTPRQPSGDGQCPKCGAPVRAGWFLCPSCKTPLN